MRYYIEVFLEEECIPIIRQYFSTKRQVYEFTNQLRADLPDTKITIWLRSSRTGKLLEELE